MLYHGSGSRGQSFRLVRQAFLQGDGLPFGDVLLGDCGFCCYFMLALLIGRGVDVVVRQHQSRRTNFRLGRRLGKEDHVVAWQRPQRPAWMDKETYATIRFGRGLPSLRPFPLRGRRPRGSRGRGTGCPA